MVFRKESKAYENAAAFDSRESRDIVIKLLNVQSQ